MVDDAEFDFVCVIAVELLQEDFVLKLVGSAVVSDFAVIP